MTVERGPLRAPMERFRRPKRPPLHRNASSREELRWNRSRYDPVVALTSTIYNAAVELSAREFATSYLAFMYTARYLAEAEMRKAQGQTISPPAHVRPDNVQLVRDNQAELSRLSDSR